MKSEKSRVILIILVIGIKSIKDSHTDISENSKKELLELLEIENAPSFKFIHRKSRIYQRPFHCYELKFKISKQDYEKNELKYSALWQECLFDCKYIEKENNSMYTCVVRCTDENNKEFYERIRNVKIKYN